MLSLSLSLSCASPFILSVDLLFVCTVQCSVLVFTLLSLLLSFILSFLPLLSFPLLSIEFSFCCSCVTHREQYVSRCVSSFALNCSLCSKEDGKSYQICLPSPVITSTSPVLMEVVHMKVLYQRERESLLNRPWI